MTDPARLPLFTAKLMTETNSFAPIPTGAASYASNLVRRDASLSDPNGRGLYTRTYRELAEAEGRAVVESLAAFAQPSGPTVQSVYESMRDTILDDLRAAMPVGLVVLALHGAMIATECDDCEGDILARVREIVGPKVTIGVELDPHCHLTEKMIASADAIVIMKLYPHTDWIDRARELYAICADTARGTIDPVSAVFDCRMVGFYPTSVAPMDGLVRLFEQTEREPGILSVSMAHGFPWGDQPEAGTRMLVMADGDRALAEATAKRLGHAVYALRDELVQTMPTIDEALARARDLDGLTVLADTADNTGGGAPGDTTHLLRALLMANLGPSAFGALYDPGAVQLCGEAGVGARVPLRIGGKLGAVSGDPLDVDVEIMALAAGHKQSVIGASGPLGDCAWVRIGEVDVLLASVRTQIYGRDAFTGIGITLADKRIVAVKSSEHFRADFAPIAEHIIQVGTPGALQLDFETIPYRHKRDLMFHPRMADPLQIDGADEQDPSCRSHQ